MYVTRSVAWVALALSITVVAAVAAPINATIVDRNGVSHVVSALNYQLQPELEVYIGGQRQLIRFRQIDRLVFGGQPGAVELPVTIHMRDARQLQGRVYADAAGGSPHNNVVSGRTTRGGFSGKSDLGRFFVLLKDVKDIRFIHKTEAMQSANVSASIVDVDGKRYQVSDLRYRNRGSFDYQQGRSRRSKAMSSIARLDFSSTGAGVERRPVTITFRSGKKTRGSVDASTIRVAGETDRLYEHRVFEAITGRMDTGPFAIGLHQLRLIRFDVADSQAEGS